MDGLPAESDCPLAIGMPIAKCSRAEHSRKPGKVAMITRSTMQVLRIPALQNEPRPYIIIIVQYTHVN